MDATGTGGVRLERVRGGERRRGGATSLDGRALWTLSDQELRWLASPGECEVWVGYRVRAAAREELERREREREEEVSGLEPRAWPVVLLAAAVLACVALLPLGVW